ncbi:hypothetical protein BH11PLA1_BH11PLA1_21290 [soil metagenome]
MSAAVLRAQELANAGRSAEAVTLLRQHCQLKPKDADASALLGHLLMMRGVPDQAVFFLQWAAALRPEDAQVLGMLGTAHLLVGASAAAEQVLRQHLRRAPDSAQGWINLGVAQLGQQKLAAAEDSLRKGNELNPLVPAGVCSLAQLLVQTGRPEEGFALARDAVNRFPQEATSVLATAAFASNYAPSAEPREVKALHLLMGSVLSRNAQRQGLVALAALPGPGAPIRIGFVSPDLNEHSVARFIAAIFEHHDRGELEVCGYHIGSRVDGVSAWLKQRAARWRHLPGGTDRELASALREEGLHVLVDLAGNTNANRLGALAHRCAPVQLAAIGYPSTTGVAEMDFRLVDEVTDPAGFEAHARERLVRSGPCFLCYTPDERLPQVAPPPALHGTQVGRAGSVEDAASVTFGSFNNLAKLSMPCLRLWARVLDAVPGSVLALKAVNLIDPGVAEIVRNRCAEAGIGAERLRIIAPTVGKFEHLAAYGAIDVALDTFPYAGTTTTCEALVMGVPVVTLGGAGARAHAARVGVSLLSAAGFREWIAEDEDGFVRIARTLALDLHTLRRTRESLRALFLGSVVCDGPAYARRFEGVIRGLMASGGAIAAGV